MQIIECKYNPDFLLYSDGRMFSKQSNLFLKTRVRRHGYLSYFFRDITKEQLIKNKTWKNKTGIRRAFSIHRLLAEHFIPNPNNYNEVNHINGIKDDNRLENLEWCNHSENCKHAISSGLHKPNKGEKHWKSILKEKDVFEILNSNLNCNILAKKYNVSRRTIYAIRSKQNWKHLSN